MAVAKAAIKSGVARKPIKDWDAYKQELSGRLGLDNKLIMAIRNKAKQNPKKVVFAEANNLRILKAVQFVKREGIAQPVLIGNEEKINALIKENQLQVEGVPIIDLYKTVSEEKRQTYANLLYEKRKRKGMTLTNVWKKCTTPTILEQ